MSEKTNLGPGLEINSPNAQALGAQGRASCQSCRYVNYNGETCGLSVSPNYAKRVGVSDWCRFWSPKIGNVVPLMK